MRYYNNKYFQEILIKKMIFLLNIINIAILNNKITFIIFL